MYLRRCENTCGQCGFKLSIWRDTKTVQTPDKLSENDFLTHFTHMTQLQKSFLLEFVASASSTWEFLPNQVTPYLADCI